MENLYVLKLSGEAVSDEGLLDSVCVAVSSLLERGSKAILVHGGHGIAEEIARRGLEPAEAGGRMVVDGDTLEAIEDVYRDINGSVTDRLGGKGVLALGIPGHFCTLSVLDRAEDGSSLGRVGTVTDSDPSSVMDLLEQGITPVVYPIGKDDLNRIMDVDLDNLTDVIVRGIEGSRLVSVRCTDDLSGLD